MSDLFSTTLYTGTGSNLEINNGIDLSGDGGLVWVKRRDGGDSHWLVDTARGLNKSLQSNSANAENTGTSQIVSFDSDGFTLGNSNQGQNYNGLSYVSWAWKKTSKFFDVLTYTGNSTNRTIAHNLGEVPGMIIVKCVSHATSDWLVYHRGADGSAPEDYGLLLNGSYARQDSSGYWNDTAPTSSVFSIGTNGNVNTNGNSYVAYLFAHNNETINCGTYTGNGSATGPVVTTGFQPQWLMFKCTSNADDWVIVDAQRGIDPAGNDIFLKPNTSGADYGFLDAISVSSTGFNVTGTDNVVNGNGRTYIYMAIAANAAGSLTWPTEVKYPSGTAPTSPSLGKKDIFNFMTVDGGTSYLGKKAVEGLS